MENFTSIHTGKDLSVSLSIIAIGIIVFFLNKWLGALVAIVGIIVFLLYKSGYKYEGGGVTLRRRTMDLCRGCRPSIMDFLNGKSDNPKIEEGTEGGIIRFEIYYNKEANIAYAQLFDYHDYSYSPLTDMMALNQTQSQILIDKLK